MSLTCSFRASCASLCSPSMYCVHCRPGRSEKRSYFIYIFFVCKTTFLLLSYNCSIISKRSEIMTQIKLLEDFLYQEAMCPTLQCSSKFYAGFLNNQYSFIQTRNAVFANINLNGKKIFTDNRNFH